ncbi:MAG: glycine dehydrogenase (aminomethyl-transferring) [candidate division Zixibacteria bacterium RBG_16_40_9]|nr:MAG: glycine dehydrogenase (aminomethyl-transferring) [candidate division Zixibacteria bacterium RBG_16_40_9]
MTYNPHTEENRKQMLKEIGVERFEDLIPCVAEEIKLKKPLQLPKKLSELELVTELKKVSEENKNLSEYINFLGAGIYDHFIPAAVDHIISRSEFYTAYTPYQAEVAQGTLQVIYEFQSLICHLTGMDVANASVYDGASAIAEAVLMAYSQTERKKVIIPENLHPYYTEVLYTYNSGLKLKVDSMGWKDGLIDLEQLKNKIDDKTAAVVVQSPNFFGLIENLKEIESLVHQEGALLIVACDPISLGILKPPGEFKADIVVGEGQVLGNSMNFGGPLLGFFATKRELIRKMPGRIAAATVDKNGNRGYVLTLQTREQHIRREKATSNICTNQGLLATAACVYLSLLGKNGLRKVAELCVQKSHYAVEQIEKITGFKRRFPAPFFKEFVIQTPVPPSKIIKTLLKNKILAGVDLKSFKLGLDDCLLVCVTEKRTKAEIDNLIHNLRSMLAKQDYSSSAENKIEAEFENQRLK